MVVNHPVDRLESSVTTYHRSGHYRTNRNGTRTWVSGHSVTRGTGGGASYRSSSTASWTISRRDVLPPQSLIVPNASCPVCGADVYFYSNRHGSRVFFDDLGPPWPKHPCVVPSGEDVADVDGSRPARPDATASRNPDAWRRSGAYVVVDPGGTTLRAYRPGATEIHSVAWRDDAGVRPKAGAVVFLSAGQASFVCEETLDPTEVAVRPYGPGLAADRPGTSTIAATAPPPGSCLKGGCLAWFVWGSVALAAIHLIVLALSPS